MLHGEIREEIKLEGEEEEKKKMDSSKGAKRGFGKRAQQRADTLVTEATADCLRLEPALVSNFKIHRFQ